MANYPIVDLENSSALRAFCYKGKKGGFIGLNEDEVKSAIKSALEARGYEVKVKWGHKPGPDIEAQLGTRLVLEAKGEGSYRQMLGNYFLHALGEILQRMSDSSVSYGIALPAHASYIELVLNLPKRVRQMLQLDFYFVRPHNTTYEIGIFRCHTD